MSKGPRYRVQFRRKREGKTNYYKRLGMIRSGKPILMLRGSLKHFRVQIVKPKMEGDIILASAWSQELSKKFGWRGYTGNVPSAYLTGLLCGGRAVKRGVTEVVPNIGFHVACKESRVFAAIKGVIDAGVKVPCSEEMLPTEERIRGEHIARYAEMILKEGEEQYYKRFSGYLSSGLRPEGLPEHFKEVKGKIVGSDV